MSTTPIREKIKTVNQIQEQKPPQNQTQQIEAHPPLEPVHSNHQNNKEKDKQSPKQQTTQPKTDAPFTDYDNVRPYNLNMVKDVVQNSDFKITDLMMQDKQGQILWTTAFITLFPGKQFLRFSSPNAEMLYEILEGKCWFTINDKGRIVHKGERILVKRTDIHMLFNQAEDSSCIFSINYQGKLNFRKYF